MKRSLAGIGWVGSESYVRGLRFKGLSASTGNVAICASKLQHYGKRMSESSAHSELGKQFLQLVQGATTQ